MGGQLRIAHFGNSVHSGGGISSVIRQHLERNDETMVVIAHATYVPEERGVIGKHKSYLNSIFQLLRLSPDCVIHVHLSQGGSIAREGLLVALARWQRRPTVLTLHGSSLAHPNRLTRSLVSLLANRSSMVHVFDEVYPHLFHIVAGKWVYVPNDVNVPLDTSGPHQRNNEIVFAGEVGLRKGADLLIQAWRMVDMAGWTLKVAGPVSGSVASLYSDAEDSVVLLGNLPHDDILALLSESKILVQPSRAEAFPMAVCEALAAGCAVIGTDVGGMGRLLRDSGQVVIEQSAAALASSLQVLLSDPVALAERARRGRDFAVSRLSSSVVSAQWRSIYADLALKD